MQHGICPKVALHDRPTCECGLSNTILAIDIATSHPCFTIAATISRDQLDAHFCVPPWLSAREGLGGCTPRMYAGVHAAGAHQDEAWAARDTTYARRMAANHNDDGRQPWHDARVLRGRVLGAHSLDELVEPDGPQLHGGRMRGIRARRQLPRAAATATVMGALSRRLNLLSLVHLVVSCTSAPRSGATRRSWQRSHGCNRSECNGAVVRVAPPATQVLLPLGSEPEDGLRQTTTRRSHGNLASRDNLLDGPPHDAFEPLLQI